MEDNNMDFMANIDLDGVVEPKPLPTGSEVTLQIFQINPKPEHSLVEYVCKIVEGDDTGVAPMVRHPLWAPKESDTAEQQNRSKLAIKRFYEAFEIEVGMPAEEQIGRQASVLLRLKTDSEYGDKNLISRFV